MHASSNFVVLIKGTNTNRNKAVKFLEKFVEIETEDNQLLAVEETYEIVWLEDLTEMFTKLAKKIPSIEFVVSGYVDCSENSGEFMDFGFIYEDGTLTIHNSDWLGYDNEDDENNRENKFFSNADMDIIDIDESFDELCTDIRENEWTNIDAVEIEDE